MVYWTISLLNHSVPSQPTDEYYIYIHSKRYRYADHHHITSPHNGCPFNAAMSRGLSSCVVCLYGTVLVMKSYSTMKVV